MARKAATSRKGEYSCWPKRDYAIVRCALDMGLRCVEIAYLHNGKIKIWSTTTSADFEITFFARTALGLRATLFSPFSSSLLPNSLASGFVNFSRTYSHASPSTTANLGSRRVFRKATSSSSTITPCCMRAKRMKIFRSPGANATCCACGLRWMMISAGRWRKRWRNAIAGWSAAAYR
jgi:hypothetical protein